MMGLALDQNQNVKLDCSNCDLGLQNLRNCGGRFREKSRSPIRVNEEIYWICPRSLIFNRKVESQLFNLYMTCKDNNVFPYGAEPLKQTSFCLDVFKFLDGILSEYHARKDKEHKAKMEKANKI